MEQASLQDNRQNTGIRVYFMHDIPLVQDHIRMQLGDGVKTPMQNLPSLMGTFPQAVIAEPSPLENTLEKHYFKDIPLPKANNTEEYCRKVRQHFHLIPQMIKDGCSVYTVDYLFRHYFFKNDEKELRAFFNPHLQKDFSISEAAKARVKLVLEIYSYNFFDFHQMMVFTPIFLNCIENHEEDLIQQIASYYFPKEKNRPEHAAEWVALLEHPIISAKENGKTDSYANHLFYPYFMDIFMEHLTDRKNHLLPFEKQKTILKGEEVLAPSRLFVISFINLLINPDNAHHLPLYFQKIERNKELLESAMEIFKDTKVLYNIVTKVPDDVKALHKEAKEEEIKDPTPTIKTLMFLSRKYHFERRLAILFTYLHTGEKLERFVQGLNETELNAFYDVMISRSVTIDKLISLDKKGLGNTACLIKKLIHSAELSHTSVYHISKYFSDYFSDAQLTALIPTFSEQEHRTFYKIMSATPSALERLVTYQTSEENRQESLLFHYYAKGIMPEEEMPKIFKMLNHSLYKVFLTASKANWKTNEVVEKSFFQNFGNDIEFVQDFILSIHDKRARQELIGRHFDEILNRFAGQSEMMEKLIENNHLIHYFAEIGDKNSFLKLKEANILSEDLLYVSFYAPDENGNTPLHFLFANEQKNFLNTLANIAPQQLTEACEMMQDLKNKDNKTPFEVGSNLFLRWAATKVKLLSSYIQKFRQEQKESHISNKRKRNSVSNAPVAEVLTETQVPQKRTLVRESYTLSAARREIENYPQELQDKVHEAQKYLCTTQDFQLELKKGKKSSFCFALNSYVYKISYQGHYYRLFYTVLNNCIFFSAFKPREDAYTNAFRKVTRSKTKILCANKENFIPQKN